MSNEYLGVYEEALRHQREHRGLMTFGEREQPSETCMSCLRERRGGNSSSWDVKKRYSWAIPNEQALKAIAVNSPNGVVEIGAGGGYWAKMLRERGVDVIAYDPAPAASAWHVARKWTEVVLGNHTAVTRHPRRTLFLCWPSYAEAWTHEVVELYDGDTIIYVGEGNGGCTGDDQMHALLGGEPYCYHDGEPCDCNWPAAKFREVETVDIPQWWGLHDYLTVYSRIR